MSSKIELLDPLAPEPVHVRQLYDYLELYSFGEPPANTLFVMGRPPEIGLAGEDTDQLLLIDPPPDARNRFRLPDNVATLFTGRVYETSLPQVQTTPGGVAHIRIGTHLLDLYSQQSENIISLPALGIVCGGVYGSDVLLPRLAPDSDGSDEVETLRLLARLAKNSHLQLYIPQVGALVKEPRELLRRLANDVAYLHNLRRVVPALAQREDGLESLDMVTTSLLPPDRRSPSSQEIHASNVRTLLANSRPSLS